MVACATSSTAAVFVVGVTTGPVRIAYSTSDTMDNPAYSSSTSVDAQGIAKIVVTGLSPETRYWWRGEDNSVIDDSRTGTFVTPPTEGSPASYTFIASGDAGLGGDGGYTGTELLPHRISNHPVHKIIAERMVAEDWLANIELGDILYYNFGADVGDTLTDYRRGYDDLFLQPNQVELFQSGNFIHIWDDHDYGPNDSDGTHPGKPNAAQVFREREPHHALPESGAIYRTWTWGRVQVVIWDCRYHRSPTAEADSPSKTMLGADQKAWFQGVLASSTAEVMIVISPVQWITGITDSWPGYTYERQEVADMITSSGWAGRMVMISADSHKLAIDTGASNHWGGWPTAVFAARDASPSNLTTGYDVLVQGGIGQYGTVTVTDLGSIITVKLTAWKEHTEVGSYTKSFTTSTPTAVADIADLVTGSHQAVIEATVVTDYQTGPAPDGETIPIESGDVRYDATADVWSTMSMETTGIDDYDGKSRFPRFATDLLAPYGNEVFLRRGVDTGPSISWVPLGYYRINATEQRGSSEGTIRLTGTDRMQGLIDARLVTPRQYLPAQSTAAVVSDLVMDVYPDAVIAWDDDSDQQPLGRNLIVEESRYEALRDIATSLGKVVYWDSEGVLRVEDAPDPDSIAWEISAGLHGVLVTSSRRVSREGMYNAVVARGQGATEAPALGIAIDIGPTSPTKWGGRFGKVPRFYESPLLTSDTGALSAAMSILGRSIGMPYSVDFGSVVNPALRPRQAVRIMQRDGNREKHIVETLTVPLTTEGTMTGTTKEQTLVQIGSLLAAGSTGAAEVG